MQKKPHFKGRRASLGISMIELALILPILLILVLGVVDFGRAILFNNILINMSREGANLAARTAQSTDDYRFIIKALNDTAAPLDMGKHGMIYIFKIKGVSSGGEVRASVGGLYRSPVGDGDTLLMSRLWACGNHWDTSGTTNGKCNLPTAPADLLIEKSKWTLPLAVGDEVRVAEIIYDYTPLSTYVMQNAVELYSSTVL